jgi:LPXTG-motif cell wall-anchored protein
MATVINNPSTSDSSSGVSTMIGMVLLLLVIVFVLMYALPRLRLGTTTPQINVPDKVDVNINQPGGQK